ncbi:MAG: alpha/beta hydrolase [Pseudomonadota bacterium]
MMEPFIFGEKPLFGVYYPSSDYSADSLVVVCPPLFDEYRRSYRALGEFADACAKKGHHALRFDYSGTGDSGGVLEDIGSIDAWLEDIESAIEEGMNLSGASRVCLVGVRFGGTLACLCRHDAVDKVLVWDGIENGSDYTKWLKNVDSILADEHRPVAENAGVDPATEDYRMFALAGPLLESMDRVRIDGSKKTVTKFLSQSELNDGNGDENAIRLNFEYDWPDFDGQIRPMLVLREMLDRL